MNEERPKVLQIIWKIAAVLWTLVAIFYLYLIVS